MNRNHYFRTGRFHGAVWRWGAMLYVSGKLRFWLHRDYELRFSERNGYRDPPRRIGRWSFCFHNRPTK